MRVGVDAYALGCPLTGIGQVTMHLLNYLQQVPELKTVEFLLYTSKHLENRLSANFHERLLPQRRMSRLGKKWWEMQTLVRATRRDKCDAFISLYQSAAVFPKTFPHFMIVHDVIHALFPEFVNTVPKRIEVGLLLRGIRHATHCIAVSEHTKRDTIDKVGVSPDKISAAHIAADPRFVRPTSGQELSAVMRKYELTPGYIYHGGGMAERKNAMGVIEAYSIMARQSSASKEGASLPKLVISGRLMPGTDLEKLIATLGINEQVRLLGEIPPEDLPAVYKGAGVFVFPSRYEGFGLPVLEAMHQGVPVVTSNVSSLPEVAGDAGFYCDPSDPKDIAEIIQMVLANRDLRERAIGRGYKRAATFTWQTFGNELVSLLTTFAEGDSAPSVIL